MTNRSDDKLATLQSLLAISGGNTNDLLQAWLVTQVSLFGNLNDMWVQLFQANGATSSSFNNAAAEFLIGLGYTGAIPDMWAAYWLAGGGTGAPDGVMLDADDNFMIFADGFNAEYA